MLKNTKIRTMFALVLALILCFSGATTAFAQSPNEEGAIVAENEDNPVQATITKNFRMPFDTTTPDATFQFQAQPVSVDGRTGEADLATMPGLNPAALTVSFTAADKDLTNPTGGILNVQKETGDLFDNVTFPHAGIFVYELTETHNTNPAIDGDAHDMLYYSQANYILTVYVANKADGSGTYVYAVGARVITDDLGEPAEGKVDPTPGGDGEDFFFSRMVFANDYVKTEGPVDPETPDPVNESTLDVSKAVAGDFADTTQYFDFTMTLAVPELVRDVPAYYKAYVVEDGVVIDPANNAVAGLLGADGTYIQISTSGPTAFALKHGQKLVFVDTPVGTVYTATEMAATHYTTTVTVVTGGGTGITLDGLATGEQLIGETANSAGFINTRDSVTPTGLNLNNLPFIGLILLAAGALVTFVAVKVRKRSY